MAGDWIKLRKDLPSDPAVIRMAALLKLDTFSLVGRLAAVWAWADTHADCHGVVTLVSRDMLDTVTQCAGFGAAMEAVGWIESAVPEGDGIRFPRFERHMGEGAKGRALAARRKENQRKRDGATGKVAASRPCHAHVTLDCDNSVTREEKRREEVIQETPSESCPEPAKAPASGQAVATVEPAVMTFPTVGPSREWSLTIAKLAEYRAAYPGADVEGELRKARQWLLDNPTRRKTAAGMPRFLGSWLGRANDRGRPATGPPAHLDRGAAAESRAFAQIAEALDR